MKPKINMTLVKDIIYLATIVIGVLFYFRDRTKESTIRQVQLETVISNQEKTFNKINELDKKFETQAELNGKLLMYIELNER